MKFFETSKQYSLKKSIYLNLRWIGIIGQFISVNLVYFYFNFEFDFVSANLIILIGINIYINTCTIFSKYSYIYCTFQQNKKKTKQTQLKNFIF